MPTIDEYRANHPRIVRERTPELRMIAHEAVRLEAVTGDEDWDHFLAYLEAALRATTRQREAAQTALLDPRMVNNDAIHACKLSIAALEARIGTLKEIITLPKFLKEQAGLARGQIAELERDGIDR